MQTTLAILGTGLIGTSLGLALHTSQAQAIIQAALGPMHILGYDQNPEASRIAHARGAIDERVTRMETAVRQAHIVVVATPVRAIQAIFSHIAPLLPAGCVVTDVASTKEQVCIWAEALLPNTVAFLGGHPMAGSERAGADAAFPELFKNAIYCLTPTVSTPQEAVDQVGILVKAIGARPYYLDPQEHDGFVAGISHLPFVLSTMLVDVVGRGAGWKDMGVLAASGFRDLSRLASGDPVMHRDICMTNRPALIRWMNEFIAHLEEMRTHLEQGDAEQILQIFERAKMIRDAWLANRLNLRP